MLQGASVQPDRQHFGSAYWVGPGTELVFDAPFLVPNLLTNASVRSRALMAALGLSRFLTPPQIDFVGTYSVYIIFESLDGKQQNSHR